MEGKRFGDVYADIGQAERLNNYIGVELNVLGFRVQESEDWSTTIMTVETETSDEPFTVTTTSDTVRRQLEAIVDELPVIVNPQYRKGTKSKRQYITLT